MEITHWLELLKRYGPIVGLLLAFVWWQARKIDQLLDRNSQIYEKEIDRLAQVQDRLLSKLLGPQPSSSNAPALDEIRGGLGRPEGKKGEE